MWVGASPVQRLRQDALTICAAYPDLQSNLMRERALWLLATSLVAMTTLSTLAPKNSRYYRQLQAIGEVWRSTQGGETEKVSRR
jgi:hypothetical protein